MFEKIKEELTNIYIENKYIDVSVFNEKLKEVSDEEKNVLYDLFGLYIRNDIQNKHKIISYKNSSPGIQYAINHVTKKLKELGFKSVVETPNDSVADILCIQENKNDIRIKVYSKQKTTQKFKIDIKYEEIKDENLYFVLVEFENENNINSYIYKSIDVSKIISENHKIYHSTLKKDGSKKNNNSMRELKVNDSHLENWDILTK